MMFANHIVGWQIDRRDEEGNKRTSIATGFIYEHNDVWVWITAGHIFEQLDLKSVTGGQLLDFFGSSPTDVHGIPARISDVDKVHFYDKVAGIDLSVVALPELHRRNLEKNNIKPIRLADCRPLTDDFLTFWMVGFPHELTSVADSAVSTSCIPIPVAQTGSPPQQMNTPTDRFYGTIPRLADLDSIEGMSGGPVFGIQRTKEGALKYWVVAVQSGWVKSESTIAACPAEIFAPAANIFIEHDLPRIQGLG